MRLMVMANILVLVGLFGSVTEASIGAGIGFENRYQASVVGNGVEEKALPRAFVNWREQFWATQFELSRWQESGEEGNLRIDQQSWEVFAWARRYWPALYRVEPLLGLGMGFERANVTTSLAGSQQRVSGDWMQKWGAEVGFNTQSRLMPEVSAGVSFRWLRSDQAERNDFSIAFQISWELY